MNVNFNRTKQIANFLGKPFFQRDKMTIKWWVINGNFVLSHPTVCGSCFRMWAVVIVSDDYFSAANCFHALHLHFTSWVRNEDYKEQSSLHELGLREMDEHVGIFMIVFFFLSFFVVCFVYCEVCANEHLWRRWSSLKHCFLAWCVCWFGSVLMSWWVGCAGGFFDGLLGWLCRWVFWWIVGLVVQVGAALRPAFAPDTSSDVTAAACEVRPLKQCVGQGCFWGACFLSPGHESVCCVAVNAKEGVWWGEKFEGESAGVCVFCGHRRSPLSK